MDVTDFVLGRGGADWGLPSGGGWPAPPRAINTPQINTPVSGAPPAAGMDLTALTNYINTLNRQGQQASNQGRIPNNPALERTSSANIGNELHGKVAPDVLRLLQQQGAERGVATGMAGSANNNAAYLQALGLTSMGLQEQGQRDLSAADARNPGAPLFDPSTQLLTPYQSGNLGLEQQRLALEAASIAARGAGGGGGRGGGYSGAPAAGGGTPDEFALGYNGPTGGPTGAVLGGLAPDFGQRQWWNSIGYGNTPTATGSTGAGQQYDAFDTLAQGSDGTASTATASSPSGIDWASLFSPNLGIDNSLYQGG